MNQWTELKDALSSFCNWFKASLPRNPLIMQSDDFLPSWNLDPALNDQKSNACASKTKRGVPQGYQRTSKAKRINVPSAVISEQNSGFPINYEPVWEEKNKNVQRENEDLINQLMKIAERNTKLITSNPIKNSFNSQVAIHNSQDGINNSQVITNLRSVDPTVHTEVSHSSVIKSVCVEPPHYQQTDKVHPRIKRSSDCLTDSSFEIQTRKRLNMGEVSHANVITLNSHVDQSPVFSNVCPDDRETSLTKTSNYSLCPRSTNFKNSMHQSVIKHYEHSDLSPLEITSRKSGKDLNFLIQKPEESKSLNECFNHQHQKVPYKSNEQGSIIQEPVNQQRICNSAAEVNKTWNGFDEALGVDVSCNDQSASTEQINTNPHSVKDNKDAIPHKFKGKLIDYKCKIITNRKLENGITKTFALRKISSESNINQFSNFRKRKIYHYRTFNAQDQQKKLSSMQDYCAATLKSDGKIKHFSDQTDKCKIVMDQYNLGGKISEDKQTVSTNANETNLERSDSAICSDCTLKQPELNTIESRKDCKRCKTQKGYKRSCSEMLQDTLNDSNILLDNEETSRNDITAENEFNGSLIHQGKKLKSAAKDFLHSPHSSMKDGKKIGKKTFYSLNNPKVQRKLKMMNGNESVPGILKITSNDNVTSLYPVKISKGSPGVSGQVVVENSVDNSKLTKQFEISENRLPPSDSKISYHKRIRDCTVKDASESSIKVDSHNKIEIIEEAAKKPLVMTNNHDIFFTSKPIAEENASSYQNGFSESSVEKRDLNVGGPSFVSKNNPIDFFALEEESNQEDEAATIFSGYPKVSPNVIHFSNSSHLNNLL